jgi:hypothetical protein
MDASRIGWECRISNEIDNTLRINERDLVKMTCKDIDSMRPISIEQMRNRCNLQVLSERNWLRFHVNPTQVVVSEDVVVVARRREGRYSIPIPAGSTKSCHGIRA